MITKAKNQKKITKCLKSLECSGFHDPKTVFRIAKFHREVGRSSQYKWLPTIPRPKPLLKHDMTKVLSIKNWHRKNNLMDIMLETKKLQANETIWGFCISPNFVVSLWGFFL